MCTSVLYDVQENLIIRLFIGSQLCSFPSRVPFSLSFKCDTISVRTCTPISTQHSSCFFPFLSLVIRAHSTPGTTLLVLAYKRRVDAREAPCFARLAKDWRFALVPRHLFDPDSFPPSSSSSSLSSPSSSSSSSTSSGIASACSNKQQQQQQQQSKGQQQQLLGDLHLLIAVRRGHSRGTGTWEGIDGEEDDPSHGAQSLGGSSRGTATGFTAHESSFIEAAFDSKICLDGSSKEALDKFCFLLCTSVSKPIGVRNT